MPDKHTLKAALGLTVGLILLVVSAAAIPLTYGPQHHQEKWAVLMFASLLPGIWGCAHLARCRGYPSVAAYGLFVLGFFFGGFIFALVRSPGTVTLPCLLSLVLPVTILFVLPNKGRHHHRHRRSKRH
jgi:uncharacterized membrane protein